MPPGGDGWYYFFAHFRVVGNEYALFNIQLNGNYLCTMVEDDAGNQNSDGGQGGCGTVVYAEEGIFLYLLKVTRSIIAQEFYFIVRRFN